MERTRIKICGITRPADASVAAQEGADAIGLVFYAPSPRNVSVEQARAVVAALPPFVTVVGLFVNEEPARVREILSGVRIDLLQFHGEEAPEACLAFGRPYLKAIRVRPGMDVAVEARRHGRAAGILLDAYAADAPGGTGQSFDWGLSPRGLDLPLVLAGGLHAGNVGAAIARVHPYAVDVSSGVEAAKGLKDRAKIRAFVEAVHGCAR